MPNTKTIESSVTKTETENKKINGKGKRIKNDDDDLGVC
jgi:hypothetical protein